MSELARVSDHTTYGRSVEAALSGRDRIRDADDAGNDTECDYGLSPAHSDVGILPVQHDHDQVHNE
ncbi:MAG: hypothetical protein Q9161_001897 [Pseudevernia consocians]